MLQLIGLMLGGLTMMVALAFATRKGEREEHMIVKIAAFLVFFATAIMMLAMLWVDGP